VAAITLFYNQSCSKSRGALDILRQPTTTPTASPWCLLLEHPQLMQRPVVILGDRALIARPVERVLDLLDQ
jgi:arsenate reductase-like glutaredoxin family protein